MPSYTTKGRALVTVTELGGPRGAAIALGVLAAAAIGLTDAYARTFREALTITVAVLFVLTLAAVIVAVTMLARRIIRELRGAAPAVDNDRLRAVERGQLDRAAVDMAPELSEITHGTINAGLPAWPHSPARAPRSVPAPVDGPARGQS